MDQSPEITSLEIYEPLPLPLVATSEEFDEMINALDSESIVDTASLVKSSSCLSLDLKRSLLFEPAYGPPPPPESREANEKEKQTEKEREKLKKLEPILDHRRDSVCTVVLKKRYSQLRGSLFRTAVPLRTPVPLRGPVPLRAAPCRTVAVGRTVVPAGTAGALGPLAAGPHKPRLERALAALPHALAKLSLQPRKRQPNRTGART